MELRHKIALSAFVICLGCAAFDASRGVVTVRDSAPLETKVTLPNGAVVTAIGGNGTKSSPYWIVGSSSAMVYGPVSSDLRYAFASLVPFEASKDRALRDALRQWVNCLPEGTSRAAYLAILDEFDNNDRLLAAERQLQQEAATIAAAAPKPLCRREGADFVCSTARSP